MARKAAAPVDVERAARGPVGSVIHAVDILRYVSEQRQPEGVTAISRALKISPSSCFNILKTLVQQEMLEFHAKTKTYSLGGETLRIARSVLDENGVLEYLRPALDELAAEHRTTASLWRRIPRERWLLVGFIESPELVRIHLSVGQRLPTFAGAMGRCVAAFTGMGAAAVEPELARVVWRNPPGLETYVSELPAVRARGFAVDDNQLNHGLFNLAAPMVDKTGQLRYCVCCTGLSGERPREQIEAMGEAAVQIAARGSANIFGAAPLVNPQARP